MKKILLAATLATTTLALSACGQDEAPEVNLDTEDKELGYSLGMMFAEHMKQDMPDMEVDAFVQGVVDGLEGNEPLLSEEEVQASIQAYQEREMQRQMEEHQQQNQGAAEENLEKSEAFLAENAEREEVITTESGLQYEVLEGGNGGTSPTAQDRVTVHYTGELIDGTVFDSSRERGEPTTFPLANVIEGWTEGLQLMKEGERFRFFIPPELAYGESGPPNIGPNQALVFDVELIEVN